MEPSFILLKYDFFFVNENDIKFSKDHEEPKKMNISLPEKENTSEINLNELFSSPKSNLK